MDIQVIAARHTVESDDKLAGTTRRTPDGYVPGSVAGYIVEECTVICADCGRNHPDIKSHPDDTELYEYSYDYIRCDSEWDFPGASCELCHLRLDTAVLVYKDGPGAEHYKEDY